MSNITSQTAANIFYKSRCEASTHNEQLSSREGAADIMLINRGRLYRIESGLTDPYPEEVLLMADLYNAPELKHYYCRNCCPLGANLPEVDETYDLDRIAVKAFAAFGRIEETTQLLMDIAEDGKVTSDEREDMQKVLRALEAVEVVTENLKLWLQKNLD